MGFIAILLIMFAFIWLVNKATGTTRITCDMVKKPHKWRRTGSNNYLACQDCGMLPGGGYKEEDPQYGD